MNRKYPKKFSYTCLCRWVVTPTQHPSRFFWVGGLTPLAQIWIWVGGWWGASSFGPPPLEPKCLRHQNHWGWETIFLIVSLQEDTSMDRYIHDFAMHRQGAPLNRHIAMLAVNAFSITTSARQEVATTLVHGYINFAIKPQNSSTL